jgi:uncharacterized protein
VEVLYNPVIVIALLVWLVTQSLKFTLARLAGKDARFSDPGGMPSAHAAVIMAAVTVIGLDYGFDDPLFGLAAVVAAIILHDAFRLRWSAGQTAERLNQVIKQTKTKAKPVVVWRGHRLREVAAGAGLGVALGGGLYVLFYY